MKRVLLVWAAMACVLLMTTSASAACTWSGTLSTDWATAGNWVAPCVTPTSTDTVTIPSAPSNQPTISTAAGNVLGITINSEATLTVASGGSVTTTGASTVNGQLTISGGSYTLNSASMAVTGAGSKLTVSSGTINVGSSTGNSLTTDSSGTLDIQGGALNIAARLRSTGTVTISSGTTTVCTSNCDNSTLGSFDISSGATLTISGGTVAFQNANQTAGTGGDLKILSGGSKSITGGSFQIGNASTPVNQNFKINSAVSIFDLTVNGTNFPTGTLDTNSLATTGTVTVSSSGTLNCGTLNVSGSGTFTLASGGSLGIGSADGITSSGATGNIRTTTRNFSTGARYIYNGNVAQVTGNGLPTSVDNLTTNNTSDIVTLSQSTTITGGISIPLSTHLRIGNGLTLTVEPNAQITGTLSGGDSSSTLIFKGSTLTNNGSTSSISVVNVTFNGSLAQTLAGSSSTTFTNLTIANSAGVTLSNNDATVNGVLALNSGNLTTGSNTLHMGSAATSTGTPSPGTDVVGNVKRTHTFTDNTVYSFGNQFVSLSFTAAGTKPTDVTINLVKAAPSGAGEGFSTAVNRTYSITQNGGAGFSATLRLHYLDSELNGNDETSASFDLWRHNGVSTWQRQVKTANSTTDNWLEKSGVTQFSKWTLAGSNPAGPTPTAVRMTHFDAVSYSDGVQLSWDSGFEVNNLGYHLYREHNGKRTRVTPSVVAGSALTVGAGNRLTAGYSYSWFDSLGTPNSVYQLEAIDLDGSRQWVGPIYPYAASTTSGSPGRQKTKLLNELVSASDDSTSASQSNISEWPAALTTREGSSLSVNSVGVTYKNDSEPTRSESQLRSAEMNRREDPADPPSQSTDSSLSVQQAIAAGKAVKIQVRKSGWYRVTRAELVAAGFDATSNAQMLQLYVDGEEVPISLSSGGAQLGPNDTIEFYGLPLDTPTSDTHTYWLISGTTAGKRMIPRSSKLKKADTNSEPAPGSFDLTTERRERLVYSSSLINGDAENHFGAPIFDQPVDQTLVARNIDRDSVSRPQLEVALQGLTAGNHRVQLRFNGSSLGTMTFAGREHSVAKFSVDPALLLEGNNVVSLVGTTGTSQISLTDWIRLTYPHQYRADNNALRFSASGGQAVRIHGFTSPNVRIVDITDPNSPIQLSGSLAASDSGYSVKVQPTGNGARILIAFTDELSEHPDTITANTPSNWNAGTNGADMLIVTHKDFRQAMEPLANLRRRQGLSVAVVDVEDIYDEFSYGAHTPLALKDFLRVTANWSRKPAYLLLVGDSSSDPRNYLGRGHNDFVPTKLIDTQLMETGSDDWVADFNALGLATVAVGRLPVRSAAEANLIVSKIISYEQERELNAPLRGAVMVADRGFEEQSSQTWAFLPWNVTVQAINRAEVGNDEVMRGKVVDALNQGPTVVNFYGHGSVRVWTSAGLLDSNLAANLTNANRPSLYVMMTCLNGHASDANIDSLSETVLKAPNGGAVAVWASSGFTTPQPQFEMNQEFYRLMFGGQPMRLGDAIKGAKAATSDMDVRRTWILLGDPAMRIR